MTPTIPEIQRVVAEHYGLEVSDLVGRGRQHEREVLPRWLTWHVCYGHGGFSPRQIATAFKRSPWTVQWGLARFSSELMEEGPDGELAGALLTVYARLGVNGHAAEAS